jgi:site-specific recombinase XerD
MNESNMEKAIRDFETHMAVERNLSPLTTKNYLIDLKQFREFLKAQHAPLMQQGEEGLSQIDYLVIRSFLGTPILRSSYRRPGWKNTCRRSCPSMT